MLSPDKSLAEKKQVVSEPEEGAITDSGLPVPEKVIVMTKRKSGMQVGAVTLEDLSRRRDRKIIIIERGGDGSQKSIDDKRRVEVVRIKHSVLAKTVEGRIIDKHLREAATDSMILIKKRRRNSPSRHKSQNSTPD